MGDTMSIAELFVDPKLNSIIKKMSNHEYDLVKSDLFLILCEKGKVESIPTYKEQIFYITRIVKNQIQSNTSPFHKTWRNQGQSGKYKTIDLDITYNQFTGEEQEDNKYQIIIDRVNSILNKDVPWYDASLFRLYYLPYDDPNCEKKVYSFRTLEKMHTSGDYKIDHMSIYHRVRNTFTIILTTLKEERLLTESEVKNLKTLKIFRKICLQ